MCTVIEGIGAAIVMIGLSSTELCWGQLIFILGGICLALIGRQWEVELDRRDKIIRRLKKNAHPSRNSR